MRKHNQIKINGVDIDTWLDSDIEEFEESPAEETTLKYDKKLVAFLDLLGITAEVLGAEEGKESDIIARMEKVKEIAMIEAKEYMDTRQLDVLHLSDSFIFVCSAELLPDMLDLLCIVQMRILIECHVLLRGALEYGNVIVKDDGRQIIGPAFIRAYQREQSDAIYPRIIISNAVWDLIQGGSPTYSSIVMTYDRERALDCLQAYCDRVGEMSIVTSRLTREGVYDHLLCECKRYDQEDRSAERRKYGWMINYLKDKGAWPSGVEYSNW